MRQSRLGSFYEALDGYITNSTALLAEIETLKANLEHAHGLGESSGFIKGHKAATAKTLTDEEKKELWNKCKFSGWDRVYEFADAILKKASEK